MTSRRRLQPKWLEIWSVGSTLLVTIGGFFAVDASARWLFKNVFAEMGCVSLAPLDFVAGVASDPFRFDGLVLLVPISVALFGAWLRVGRHEWAGTACLVAAPQVALLLLLLAFAALMLPFAYFFPRPPTPTAVPSAVRTWQPFAATAATTALMRQSCSGGASTSVVEYGVHSQANGYPPNTTITTASCNAGGLLADFEADSQGHVYSLHVRNIAWEDLPQVFATWAAPLLPSDIAGQLHDALTAEVRKEDRPAYKEFWRSSFGLSVRQFPSGVSLGLVLSPHRDMDL